MMSILNPKSGTKVGTKLQGTVPQDLNQGGLNSTRGLDHKGEKRLGFGKKSVYVKEKDRLPAKLDSKGKPRRREGSEEVSVGRPKNCNHRL